MSKTYSKLIYFLIFAAIVFSSMITFTAENIPSDNTNTFLKHVLISAGTAVFAVYIAFAVKFSHKSKEDELYEKIS